MQLESSDRQIPGAAIQAISAALTNELVDDIFADHETDAIAVRHPTPLSPEEQLELRSQDYQLRQLLSSVLKYGVWVACMTVLIGGILYLVHHGGEPVSYRVFQGEPDLFRSPKGVVEAIMAGRRRGVIQLGLLFLIATPIIRVIVSLLIFLKQRDRVYIVLTSLVLAGLIYSFLGAYF